MTDFDHTTADDTRTSVHVVSTVDFETMYRHEYPGLLAVATALSGSVEQGEDTVHDTMVKALIHWPKVSRLDRPGGWCHRVLVNACRSWWRRTRTQARYIAGLRKVESESSIGTTNDIAEAMAFWQAVRTLPERPRLAVTLFYAGDRTVAEVASILDVPEGTVRSDLTRARQALATQLEL